MWPINLSTDRGCDFIDGLISESERADVVIKIHVLHGRRRGFHVSIRGEQDLHGLQGGAKERELSLVKEVPSGMIDCVSAAITS